MSQATAPVRADDPGWNDPGIAVLVGLGPLLPASGSFASGLALGSASLVVLCTSNVLASILARWIPARFHPASFVLLIAALVTAVDLLFQVRWFGLHGQVGQFLPLIVVNGLILARAQEGAAAPGWWPALRDGLMYGAAFILLLAGLGALRETLAPGLPVIGLPAGVLFLLGGLLALRQAWLRRRQPA